MIKPIEHLTIQEASVAFEDGIASYTARAFFQHLRGELDARMMQEIRKTLTEQGYTDLYVIGDDFILEAIKREVERRENKPLTMKELRERHGKPIFYVSLPAWLLVDDECEEIKRWGICDMSSGKWHSPINKMPWHWSEVNYGKLWLAYDHELERS